MYTRYYDSYPATIQEPPIDRSKEDACPPQIDESSQIASRECSKQGKGIFGNMKTEDLLLVALLMITVLESNDDFILPLILGALLLE